MKKMMTFLFRSKPSAYELYKEHCSAVKAFLAADPGFVSVNDRHDHIVQQRKLLSSMLN